MYSTKGPHCRETGNDHATCAVSYELTQLAVSSNMKSAASVIRESTHVIQDAPYDFHTTSF